MHKFLTGLLVSAALFATAHAAGKNDGSMYIEQRCSAIKTLQLDGSTTKSNNVWNVRIYNDGSLALQGKMAVDKMVEGNLVSSLYEVNGGYYELILQFLDDGDRVEYALAMVDDDLNNLSGIEVGKCQNIGVFSVNR